MDIQQFYKEDKYIEKNPTLHEEDSLWKISKILPFIDILFKEGYITQKEISLLDVGGGAGLIIKEIAEYISINYNTTVNKICLDLSPKMLIIQKKSNPEAAIINGDICETTIKNGSIDITLMIDVLEHIPDWEKALEELSRISKYVIFKVPLEKNFLTVTWNILRRGDIYRQGVENIGHIHWFNINTLSQGIKMYYGPILNISFTNVFDYNLKYNNKKHSKIGKVINFGGRIFFSVSPVMCSFLFFDFGMILAKSNETFSH